MNLGKLVRAVVPLNEYSASELRGMLTRLTKVAVVRCGETQTICMSLCMYARSVHVICTKVARES